MTIRKEEAMERMISKLTVAFVVFLLLATAVTTASAQTQQKENDLKFFHVISHPFHQLPPPQFFAGARVRVVMIFGVPSCPSYTIMLKV